MIEPTKALAAHLAAFEADEAAPVAARARWVGMTPPRGRAARTMTAKFVPLATSHLERSALNEDANSNCDAAGTRGGERATRRQGTHGRAAVW